jgi:hypothetical protein
MKHLILKISLVLSLFFVAGCSDFLDTPHYGRPTGWQTKEDVDMAIAALYEFVSLEEVSGRGHMWLEACSDNMVPGRAQAEAEQIRAFQMTPENGRDVRMIWGAMYKNVARANNIIKLVPDMSLDPAYIEQTVGIGYFFRGFSMLWLAPWYGDNGPNGGIPIILETTEPADMDIPRPASVLANYDQIISDMYTAGDMLPLFSQIPESLYGYPHKAAAWAFGARAALYAAQYDNSYYNTVIDFCDKIIALTGADKRELFDDGSANPFAKLWRKENNFSSEYIFSMLGTGVIKSGSKYHGMSFNQDGYSIINTWGYFQPTLELYNAFEPNDKRLEASILYPGEHIQFVGRDVLFGGTTYDNISNRNRTWNITSTTRITWRKFMSPYEAADCLGKDVNTDGNFMTNTLATCLVRFADVLLMKAEALIWKNGEGDGEAKQLINRIRKRARLPENTAATKDQLKNERRVELAGEFLPSRHIDVVRWGDAQRLYAQQTLGLTYTAGATVGAPVVVTGTYVVNESRTFNPAINHVFPIPARALEGTVNLKQNIGY